MDRLNKTIIILCEGSSEFAYIQELNKYFRENKIGIVFSPKLLDGGDYSNIKKKFREARKNNPKSEIEIFVDFDIYQRNNLNNGTKYNANRLKDGLPEFLFNRMNFEDFLVIHLDDKIVHNFDIECKRAGHHISPLPESVYLNLYRKNVFEGYTKGSFSFPSITADILDNLFRNNKDNNLMFKSDFATFLEKLLLENSGDEQ